MGKRKKVNSGDLFSSNNYGDFNIIKELPSINKRRIFEIKFIQTQSIRSVTLREAMNGEVKDLFLPSIYGVGYLGNGHKKGNNKLYNVWINILDRCYNPNNHSYMYYGYKGVTVDTNWHCFEIFLKDVVELDGYENLLISKNKIELDKDLLQKNIDTCNKVYSKNTCVWILKSVNNYMQILNKNATTNVSSKYVGVCHMPKSGNWQVSININKKMSHIGTFSNEIAAANAYNYYAKKNNENCIQNDCPFMKIEEWMKYKS